MLLVVEILADNAVCDAKLALNEVAALPLKELADWNAPPALADTITILSV